MSGYFDICVTFWTYMGSTVMWEKAHHLSYIYFKL